MIQNAAAHLVFNQPKTTRQAAVQIASLASSCCSHQIQNPDTCLQNHNENSSVLPELSHSDLHSLLLTTLDQQKPPDTTTATGPENFERLLRAIYAPQNIYCVHVDKKTEASALAAIMAITSCFPNVFLASRPVSVVYAAWPRVQADLNCMADLYNVSTEWKYFINVCGQDFPLKTNLEIVRTLRSLKGRNSMESEKMPDGKIWRVTNAHRIGTGQKKTPPPFNLPILSGNAYIVVSRGYIRSVLEDERIQTLMEWAKDTYSPDEFLWATIQRMPGVPGSTRPHRKYDMTDINAIARLVKWQGHVGPKDSLDAVYPQCHGDYVRGICVYGAGDLQWMIAQHHLFANKFDINTDPIAIYCLEKYLRLKALAEEITAIHPSY
uniref:Glucosaminyl (N-acetyl) transferase 3, mucin type n=1 Tax=Stegastes partitus TaxID=144197 RepID=A0A3B4ZCA0_9TELE